MPSNATTPPDALDRAGAAAMRDGMMRALVGATLGPPDAFALAELPIPIPGPGEVRIAVDAVTFGFVDGLIAAGRYQIRPALPFVPGGEIAGTVDALGAGVSSVAIGDRVACWCLGGGAAEYCLAPAAGLEPIPDGLDPVTAAAVLVDGPTAQYALFDRGSLRAGETVLVLGGAGGVGAIAIQVARRAGAFVVAAAGSAEKRAHALALGAHVAIDYHAPDWRETLRAALPARGLDIVFDPVGGATFEPAFRSLAKEGRHLVLGFAGGEIPRLPANLPLLKSAALIGVDLRHLVAIRPGEVGRLRQSVFAMARDGALTVSIGARLHLADAAHALVLLGRRDRIGKVALLPRA